MHCTLCTFIGLWKCGRDRGLRREGSVIAVETMGGYEGRGSGFMHKHGIDVRVAIDGVRSWRLLLRVGGFGGWH